MLKAVETSYRLIDEKSKLGIVLQAQFSLTFIIKHVYLTQIEMATEKNISL